MSKLQELYLQVDNTFYEKGIHEAAQVIVTATGIDIGEATHAVLHLAEMGLIHSRGRAKVIKRKIRMEFQVNDPLPGPTPTAGADELFKLVQKAQNKPRLSGNQPFVGPNKEDGLGFYLNDDSPDLPEDEN